MTPRKRWCKVSTDILREPGSREVRFMRVLLRALLTERWADDGEAGRAVLSEAELVALTGKKQTPSALKALGKLMGTPGLSIDFSSGSVAVSWPNYADFQEVPARVPGKPRTENAPSVQVPIQVQRDPSFILPSRPAAEQRPTLFAVANTNKKRKHALKAGPTKPPDRLSDQQRTELEAWAREHKPDKLSDLHELEAACLDHFRGSGKMKTDWPATVRNWVRNSSRFEWSGPPRKHLPNEIPSQEHWAWIAREVEAGRA